MKTLHLFYVEVRRVFRSRSVWLAAALTVLSLLGGFYTAGPTTMSSMYLAFQIRAATLAGTVLFAILMLYTLSRVQKSRMDAIMDSIVSPQRLAFLRLLAVQCAALGTALLAMFLYMPFALWKLGLAFDLGDYVCCFLLLLFPGLFFGCLTAAVCYQIFRRFDVSLVAVLVFLLLSGSGQRAGRFLWQWSLPLLPALSDDFSNAVIFRTALYSRLVWLLLLGGVWLLALLCVRRYGKGLPGSIRCNATRAWVPVLAVALLAGGAALWQLQPFYDHTPADWMALEEQDYTRDGVFLTDAEVDARVESELLGTLRGTATWHLENATGEEQPFYFALNAGYRVRGVTANGEAIPFEHLEGDYIAGHYVRCTLPAAAETELQIDYGGMPQIWNAMEHQAGDTVISRDYIYLNGKSLAPAPDVLLKELDVSMTLRFTMRSGLTPVTNGYAPALLRDNGDGTSTWEVQNTGFLSPSLFAGDFAQADLAGGGMPIQFYYSRKHQAQLEELGAIQAMEAAIRYCTEHYGPRSFTEEKPFKIIQGTEFLFGGFARDNISVISEDSFTAENLSDPEKGADGAQVAAHEIIHQWWGLGQMLMDPEDPWWSAEGITTYTTYRLMKEQYGAEYADRHYLAVWKQELAENRDNFYVRHPEYLDRLPEQYAADLKVSTQGVYEYSGYAYMFCRAAELLGGEAELDAVLERLYREGGTEMPPYITLNDFLDASGLTKEALGLD